jgi:hypothetical protein
MSLEEFTSQLKIHRKKINRSLFGAILVCFFMPFLTLSCQSQDLMTLSGVQLGTGATMSQPSLYGSAQSRQIPAEPLATLVIIAAGTGLATTFVLKHRKDSIGSTAAGAAGAILLLILKSKIDGDILQQGQAMVRVRYEFGFWLAFLLFVAATGLNGWDLKTNPPSTTVDKNLDWISATPPEATKQSEMKDSGDTNSPSSEV